MAAVPKEQLTPVLSAEDRATPMPALAGGRLMEELRTKRKATARDAFGLSSALWAEIPDALIEHVARLSEEEMRANGHVLALLVLMVSLIGKPGMKHNAMLDLRRPIENGASLLGSIDRILLKELRCTARLLTSKQFSSVPGKTIHGAGRLTRNVLEYARLEDKGVSVCLTDCAQYFVTPDHEIAERFFDGRIPDDLLKTIMASARYREMIVKTIRGNTWPLGASRGFGQGQVLSCLLACLYFDCVNRQLDRGQCRQINHKLLGDDDIADLLKECIPFAGPVPVGTVGVTDDFLAIRTNMEALIPAVETFIKEIRARGGDSQLKKFCVVNFIPGGGVGHKLYEIDGREIRTPRGGTVNGEKISGMIPKHAGFPVCMRGRLPAYSEEVLSAVRGCVRRLRGHRCRDSYLTIRELRVIIAGAIQAKFVFAGAIPLLSPSDLEEIDASIAVFIRDKMMVVRSLPKFWHYLPRRYGGQGLLSSGDRYFREFLLRYIGSFNDRDPSAEVRDSTRACFFATIAACEPEYVDWDLDLIDDAQWTAMLDAEKLFAVASHYYFRPLVIDGSDGSFRRLIGGALPGADPAYAGKRVITGSDGSAADGRASYASVVCRVDQLGNLLDEEPAVVSDRVAGLQDIHRAELVGAIVDVLRTMFAASATHYIDRISAVKAIQRAIRKPESISKMPEAPLISLLVSAFHACTGVHDWKWQQAHSRDTEQLNSLRDDPPAFVNRVADENSEKALRRLQDPANDFYDGEYSPHDLVLWDLERDCIASSPSAQFKVNAQLRHMETVPDDARVHPTPAGIHPDSWAFTRDEFLPDSLHKALYRMRTHTAATFETLTDVGNGDGHCQLCNHPSGSAEHLLLTCPSDRCWSARDEALADLHSLFDEAAPGLTISLMSDSDALVTEPSERAIPVGVTGVLSSRAWCMLRDRVPLAWVRTALKGDLESLSRDALMSLGTTAIVRKLQWILATLAKEISTRVSAPIARQFRSPLIRFDPYW